MNVRAAAPVRRSRQRSTAGGLALVTGLFGLPALLLGALVATAPSAAAAGAQAGDVFPLVVSRLADTRSGVGVPRGAVTAGAVRTVTVAGRGGVPTSGAAAVVLSVTVIRPTRATALTVWPAGATRPSRATLSAPAASTVTTTAIVRLGKSGAISFRHSAGSAQVTIDVQGWVSNGQAASAGDRYVPLNPALLLDTARGIGAHKGALGSHRSLTFQVGGKGGVPSGTPAAVLGFTFRGGAKATSVTVWPAGAKRPTVTNAFVPAKGAASTLALTRLGSGRVSVFSSSGSVQVTAVVQAFATTPAGAGSSPHVQPLAAAAVFDTAKGLGTPRGKLTSTARTVVVAGRGGVPAGATGAVLDLTASGATRVTQVFVWPAGAKRPATPTMVIGSRPAISAAVSVRLPTSGLNSGRIKMAASGGSVQLAGDAQAGILAPSTPLAVTTVGLSDAALDAAYSQALTSTGGYGAISWSLAGGSLPAGLSLSTAGLLGGTPTGAGTSVFTVRASDANLTSATRQLSITVTSPGGPAVTTSSLPPGTVGVAYNAPLSATGGSAPYSWDVIVGALPPGVQVSGSAVSGTPTAAGAYDVTLRVTDNVGQQATRDFTLTIGTAGGGGGSGSPTITTTTLPQGRTGSFYDVFVAATGGATPYSWSLAAGALPDGLGLDPFGGEISGTPTTDGTSNFTVELTDYHGTTTSRSLSITISSFSITTSSLPAGTVGVAYDQTINTTNGTAPVTMSVTTGTLPDGLTLNSSTGQVTGTPTTTGTFPFTVSAQDAVNSVATKSFSISVTTSPVPVITTTDAPGAEVGVIYTFRVAAIGGTTPYSWTLLSGTLPSGLGLSPQGVISGTPTGTGPSSFTVKVTDASANADTQALSITVSADSDWRQPERDAGARRFAPSETVVTSTNVADVHPTWSVVKHDAATPAVVAGVAYSAGGVPGSDSDNALYAYDLAKGDVLWQVATTCVGGQVAVTATAVLFPCGGVMRAYSLASPHNLLWDTAGTDPTAQITDFVVLSDRVVAWDSSAVYAYDLSTGNRMWRVLAPSGQFITAAAATEDYTVAVTGSYVRAYYTHTANGHTNGTAVWTATTTTAVGSTLIDNGSVFVFYDGAIHKLDVTTGSVQQTLSSAPAGDPTLTPANFDLMLAADGTNIYVRWIEFGDFGSDGKVVALKESDLSWVWSADGPQRSLYGTVAGSLLYVTWHQVGGEGSSGGVWAYDRTTGQLLRPFPDGAKVFTPAVAAEGRLLVTRPAELDVYGFDPPAPTITTTILKSGHVGTAYSDTLQVSSGTAPYTWSITGGALPGGLGLSSDGTISGTPTGATTASVTIRVSDAYGITRARSYTIEISPSTTLQWLTLGGASDRRGYASGETQISQDTLPALSQQWSSAQIGQAGNYSTAGDFAVTSSYVIVPEYTGGHLDAFPRGSGSTSGRTASWQAVTDNDPGNNQPVDLVSGVTVSPDGARALVLARDGLYSFNTSTGAKQWKAAASITTFGLPSPTVVGTRVMVAIDNAVYAFNLSDGSVSWGPVSLVTHGSWGLNLQSAFASDGTDLFVTSGCTLYALTAATGVEDWDQTIAASGVDSCGAFSSDSVPLVVNGVVYAGSYGGTGAFNAGTGAVIWQKAYLSGGAMAEVGGVLVVGVYIAGTSSYTPEAAAVDAETGQILWANPAAAMPFPVRFVVTADLVFAPTLDNKVSMLDLTTGDIVNTTTATSGTNPQLVYPVAVTGGGLYFMGNDGMVHAYGVT